VNSKMARMDPDAGNEWSAALRVNINPNVSWDLPAHNRSEPCGKTSAL